MTDMIEVKTADLIGPALDYAVAKAEGLPLSDEVCQGDVIFVGRGDGDLRPYAPSTNWEECGPLIDKYKPDVGPFNGAISAYLNNRLFDSGPLYSGHGETYLVAACRVIVLFRLGDTVSVPKELMP